jgi:hypothetical protein
MMFILENLKWLLDLILRSFLMPDMIVIYAFCGVCALVYSIIKGLRNRE